ncbi:hypothetical protein [Halalkalicoccus ordinarius]|uniref:hypothetical protein n=1 Tax=Halalkalicoccus ordinarius TaxID=3116651 RepID=UPI00300E7FCC
MGRDHRRTRTVLCGGAFHTESDAASRSVGSAAIEVRADEHVEDSVPCYEIGAAVETLEFDHHGGEITVESEELRYRFRRP